MTAVCALVLFAKTRPLISTTGPRCRETWAAPERLIALANSPEENWSTPPVLLSIFSSCLLPRLCSGPALLRIDASHGSSAKLRAVPSGVDQTIFPSSTLKHSWDVTPRSVQIRSSKVAIDAVECGTSFCLMRRKPCCRNCHR
jgi:hypothetical protein